MDEAGKVYSTPQAEAWCWGIGWLRRPAVESVAEVGRQCDADVFFPSHESGWQAVGYRDNNSTDPVSVAAVSFWFPCGRLCTLWVFSNFAKVKSGEHAERTHPTCMAKLGQWRSADPGQRKARWGVRVDI